MLNLSIFVWLVFCVSVVYQLEVNHNKESVEKLYLQRSPPPWKKLALFLTRAAVYFPVDPVCDLVSFKKFWICEAVFNHEYFRNELKVILKKQTIISASDYNCELFTINIQQDTKMQRMYYCITENENTNEDTEGNDMYYISEAFAEESVFIYRAINILSGTVEMIAHVRGIDLSNILPSFSNE